MDRDQALTDLRSDDAGRRLAAARRLADVGELADGRAISFALRRERDRWVRQALIQALQAVRLKALNGRPRRAPERPEVGAARLAVDLRAEATKEVVSLLLHEIRPIVGEARAHATREWPGFPDSATSGDLDRLVSLLAAFDILHRSSEAPTLSEKFDLALLVDAALESLAPARPESPVITTTIGERPYPLTGSRGLVDIAIRNGIRNAVEATEEAIANDMPTGPILVSWEATDRQHVVRILDEGVGLPDSADQAFELGRSTKEADTHFGVGLWAARLAASSLGGDVTLTPRSRGVAYTLRWPIGDGGL